jgi:hypothetical protein
LAQANRNSRSYTTIGAATLCSTARVAGGVRAPRPRRRGSI